MRSLHEGMVFCVNEMLGLSVKAESCWHGEKASPRVTSAAAASAMTDSIQRQVPSQFVTGRSCHRWRVTLRTEALVNSNQHHVCNRQMMYKEKWRGIKGKMISRDHTLDQATLMKWSYFMAEIYEHSLPLPHLHLTNKNIKSPSDCFLHWSSITAGGFMFPQFSVGENLGIGEWWQLALCRLPSVIKILENTVILWP